MLNIINLLIKNAQQSKYVLILMILVAGTSQVLLFYIINNTITFSFIDTQRYFYIYLITLGLLLYAKQSIYFYFSKIVEDVAESIRLRLLDKLYHVDIEYIEAKGIAYTKNIILSHSEQIRQSTFAIIDFIEAVIVIFLVFIYLFFIAIPGFFVIAGSLLIASLSYHFYQTKISDILQKSKLQEKKLQNNLLQFIDSIVYLKTNKQKQHAFFKEIKKLLEESKYLKIKANYRIGNSIILIITGFFLAMAAVAFLLTAIYSDQPQILTKLVIMILFISTALRTFIMSFPKLRAMDHALKEIDLFEADLDIDLVTDSINVADNIFNDIDSVTLEAVTYYKDTQDDFKLAPIYCQFFKGQLIILTGELGSYHTLYLKLFSALYPPTEGMIKVNNNPLEKNILKYYHTQCAVILNDYHLPEILLPTNIDSMRIVNLLKVMQLDKIITFNDGKLSYEHLSLLEQKRLDLMINLLDNKSIYIIDSWIMQQSNLFKRYFYEVIVKRLKQQGKIIIIATQESKYFTLADQLFIIDSGKLIVRQLPTNQNKSD